MEKYYTPELGEIHIGFPYRHLSDGLFEDSDESFYGYYNRVYEPTQDYVFGYSQKEWEERVSVKFLDREDIESEGWTREAAGTYLYDKFMLMDVVKLNKNGKRYVVWNGKAVVFQGTIKNISELRKIQKQLGIK